MIKMCLLSDFSVVLGNFLFKKILRSDNSDSFGDNLKSMCIPAENLMVIFLKCILISTKYYNIYNKYSLFEMIILQQNLINL